MIRGLIFAASCGLFLAGCADTRAPDDACMQPGQGKLGWGYYPGYGCGPVPPAQTKFSWRAAPARGA